MDGRVGYAPALNGTVFPAHRPPYQHSIYGWTWDQRIWKSKNKSSSYIYTYAQASLAAVGTIVILQGTDDLVVGIDDGEGSGEGIRGSRRNHDEDDEDEL